MLPVKLEVHHIKLFYHLFKNRNLKKYIERNRNKIASPHFIAS